MEIEVRASRTYPRERAHVYRVAIAPESLTIFEGAFPIPGIAGVEMEGKMEVGAVRRVELSDGSRIREEITALEEGRIHGYDVHPPMPLRLLAGSAHGRWEFADAGEGGTEVTWSYRFRLTTFLVWPVARLVAGRFQKAMANALDNLADRLGQ